MLLRCSQHSCAFSADISKVARLRKLRQDYSEEKLDGTQYAERLRAQFERIHGKPEWAEAAARGEEQDDDAVLQRSGRMFGQGRAIAPTVLETTRLRNANHASPSEVCFISIAVCRDSFHALSRIDVCLVVRMSCI